MTQIVVHRKVEVSKAEKGGKLKSRQWSHHAHLPQGEKVFDRVEELKAGLCDLKVKNEVKVKDESGKVATLLQCD